MGCFSSSLVRRMLWGANDISEKEIQRFDPEVNPKLKDAMDLVSEGVREANKELTQITHNKQILETMIVGLSRRCRVVRNQPLVFEAAKEKLRSTVMELDKLKQDADAVQSQLNVWRQQADNFEKQARQAKQVRRTMELHQTLRASGMDPERFLNVAIRAQEMQANMTATTNVMASQQQVFASVSQSVSSMSALAGSGNSVTDDAKFNARIDQLINQGDELAGGAGGGGGGSGGGAGDAGHDVGDVNGQDDNVSVSIPFLSTEQLMQQQQQQQQQQQVIDDTNAVEIRMDTNVDASMA